MVGAGKRASGPLILIVEDAAINQQVALGMLERLGYRAVVANNGREALAAMARDTYAAVLMDCQMPVMDGYEATIAIRRKETPEHHIPVIAMTANAMVDNRGRCLAVGMDDFMDKPIRLHVLGAALARWVGPGYHQLAPEREAEPPRASPEVAVASTAAVLDMEVLALLRRPPRPGQPDAFVELVRLFAEEANASVGSLRAALQCDEAVVLAREGHALKGMAATIGAKRVQRLAEQLEHLGRGGTTRGAEELVDYLAEALAETCAHLEMFASQPTV